MIFKNVQLRHIFAPFIQCLLISLSLMPAVDVHGVEDSALWLPAKYQSFIGDLKQAAEKLESQDGCVKVMRGTMQKAISEEQAIFKFVCRNTEGSTYSILFDQTTQAFTYPAVQTNANNGFDAAQRAVVSARLMSECQSLFKTETAMLINAIRPEDDRARPVLEDSGALTLKIPFSAEDMLGNPLQYLGVCSLAPGQKKPTFEIKVNRP